MTLRILPWTLALLLLSLQAVYAQLPHARLSWVYPPGGQQDKELEVTVDGVDLDETANLFFSHPAISARPKTTGATPWYGEGRPIPNQFVVSIPAAVPPGIYELRTVGFFGLSNPRAFVVGPWSEMKEKEGNDASSTAMEISLETTVNGRANAAGYDFYKFSLGRGQRVLIDCWAHRIDSRLDANLVIYDVDGQALFRSHHRRGRDPFVDFTAPADGTYMLSVHDSLYKGGMEYFYRFTLSSAPYIEYVFPPSGPADSKGRYTLYGRNLPGSSPAENLVVDGVQLEKLAVEIQLPGGDSLRDASLSRPFLDLRGADIAAIQYRLPSPRGISNPVQIGIATAPIVVEQEPNDQAEQPQKVTPPCEFVGQFYPLGDNDWIQFEAKKGDYYWIEVISQRLGLPTDPYVLVQKVITNDAGETTVHDVQDADDSPAGPGGPGFGRPTDDPVFAFRADENAYYRILVRDLYTASQASPRYVYRLSIRNPQPDFQLITAMQAPAGDPKTPPRWNPVLRKGGTTPIRILALRRDGFQGDIVVSADGLPTGVTCQPTKIVQGSNQCVLVLEAAPDANAWTGPFTVTGRAKVGKEQLVRRARSASFVWDTPSPGMRLRLTRDTALAVTAETSPIQVVVGEQKKWETSRAGKLTIPFQVERRVTAKGSLNLNPVGLPKGVEAKAITIDEKNTDGKLDVTVDSKVRSGSYTFFVEGKAKVAYRRNPEAAKRAEADKQKVNETAQMLAAASEKAKVAQQEAEKRAQQTAEEAARAIEEAERVDKEVSDAETHTNTLIETIARAKAAAQEHSPGDNDLVDTLLKAEKIAREAASRNTQAMDEQRTAKEAAAREAARLAGEAEKEKIRAVEYAKQAERQSSAAQEAKKQAEERAKQLAEAANPSDKEMYVASTPVSIAIAEAPLKLQTTLVSESISPGQNVELRCAVKRLYEFTDSLDIHVAAPENVKGIESGTVHVAGDKSDVQLVLKTDKQAPPGRHQLVITAKLKFHGQDLEVRRKVVVNIAEEPSKVSPEQDR